MAALLSWTRYVLIIAFGAVFHLSRLRATVRASNSLNLPHRSDLASSRQRGEQDATPIPGITSAPALHAEAASGRSADAIGSLVGKGVHGRDETRSRTQALVQRDVPPPNAKSSQLRGVQRATPIPGITSAPVLHAEAMSGCSTDALGSLAGTGVHGRDETRSRTQALVQRDVPPPNAESSRQRVVQHGTRFPRVTSAPPLYAVATRGLSTDAFGSLVDTHVDGRVETRSRTQALVQRDVPPPNAKSSQLRGVQRATPIPGITSAPVLHAEAMSGCSTDALGSLAGTGVHGRDETRSRTQALVQRDVPPPNAESSRQRVVQHGTRFPRVTSAPPLYAVATRGLSTDAFGSLVDTHVDGRVETTSPHQTVLQWQVVRPKAASSQLRGVQRATPIPGITSAPVLHAEAMSGCSTDALGSLAGTGVHGRDETRSRTQAPVQWHVARPNGTSAVSTNLHVRSDRRPSAGEEPPSARAVHVANFKLSKNQLASAEGPLATRAVAALRNSDLRIRSRRPHSRKFFKTLAVLLIVGGMIFPIALLYSCNALLGPPVCSTLSVYGTFIVLLSFAAALPRDHDLHQPLMAFCGGFASALFVSLMPLIDDPSNGVIRYFLPVPPAVIIFVCLFTR